jgi:hypothetical protein
MQVDQNLSDNTKLSRNHDLSASMMEEAETEDKKTYAILHHGYPRRPTIPHH